MTQIRIVSNPTVFDGKPIIEGTRVSVEMIVTCHAAGWTTDMILNEYPHLTYAHVLAALAFDQEQKRRAQE